MEHADRLVLDAVCGGDAVVAEALVNYVLAARVGSDRVRVPRAPAVDDNLERRRLRRWHAAGALNLRGAAAPL